MCGWSCAFHHSSVVPASGLIYYSLPRRATLSMSADEPSAYDSRMCQGAVSGRAETILRSAKASALGNCVHYTPSTILSSQRDVTPKTPFCTRKLCRTDLMCWMKEESERRGDESHKTESERDDGGGASPLSKRSCSLVLLAVPVRVTKGDVAMLEVQQSARQSV